MNGNLKVKYDDECLLNEDRFQLLQQKKLIEVLLNGGQIQFEDRSDEEEIIVSLKQCSGVLGGKEMLKVSKKT